MTEIRAIARQRDDQAPHALHSRDRAWPETNCYLDLWIELLHALGRDPLPLLGLAMGLDWEVDHFTFLKPSAAEIFAATGVVVHELALWDDTLTHVLAQVGSGAVPLLEVDAFYLPDTRSDAYRRNHTKTTIGITAIDPDYEVLEYFHNAGRYNLCDEDYRGLLGASGTGLFPFAELARAATPAPAPSVTRRLAADWIDRYARTRAPGNPIVRFGAALPDLLARVGRDPGRINALCFNTTRQLGGAFELLADHSAWLGLDPADPARLANSAKTLQFQIARAARRGRTEIGISAALDEIAGMWEKCVRNSTRCHPRMEGAPGGGQEQAIMSLGVV